MNATELRDVCKSQTTCENCKAVKPCQKWRELTKKVSQLEPGERKELLDLIDMLTEGEL